MLEMLESKAATMGVCNGLWMYEFSGYFHNVVTDVSISARMQEECDVLCLQIAKVAKGTVNLAEYMLCMRASLRSLLPKGWSTVREVAWTWLWEDVERLLLRNIGNPLVWERRLAKLFPGIDEQQECELRAAIHTRFFALTPAGKDCFKQSNTYLHVTADKVLDVTVTFFREPVKIIDEISALGLRHVGYDTPIELFIPFVWACVEVVSTACPDGEMIVSFRWPLGLVAKVMQRTITEGSTIVMKVWYHCTSMHCASPWRAPALRRSATEWSKPCSLHVCGWDKWLRFSVTPTLARQH